MQQGNVKQDPGRLIEADWHESNQPIPIAYEEARLLRECPYVIGQTYYFRLATYAWCGTVVAVGSQEIVIEPAAAVFDSGRFSDALRNGLESNEESEIEPVDEPVIVGRYSVVDCVPYRHAVPREQK